MNHSWLNYLGSSKVESIMEVVIRSGFSREFEGIAAKTAATVMRIKRVHLQFLLSWANNPSSSA